MKLNNNIISDLKKIVGDDGILLSSADLASYSYDGSCNWQSMPDVVVFPQTTEQVSDIMKLAYENTIPITPRGAGTSLSGGPVPSSGGIVLCTARMNRILEIDEENFAVTAEAGVVLNNMNMELAKRNLFFPPDPQSFLAATIGGCIAVGAGGPYAVKYGVFKHYILGMTIVLANGSIIDIGGNTMKNVTGYDLPQLVCGSEGTLCTVTKIKLRLVPKPKASQTITAVFNDVTNAGNAVHMIKSKGVIPAKIELIDNWVINRVNEITGMGFPSDADAILFFEVDGSPESIKKEEEDVVALCKEAGAEDVWAAKDAEDAMKVWGARRSGFLAIYGNAPTALAEDVTVPTNKISEFLERVKDIRKKYDVEVVIIGHAGDGNLHPTVLTDKKDTEHYERADKAVQELFKTALNLGGAISGEHGIGLEKQRFLKDAISGDEINLLKGIKKIFDPKGILNPGKIWEQ
ncbi:MAG: FAD-binding protein [Spirochaetes bacterium]|nr:FAD-binding protein [Spirochaetota bacterium]